MSFGRVYQYSNAVQAHSAAHFWDIDYTGIIKAGDIKGTFLRVWENCGVCIRNILSCQVHIIAIVLYTKLVCCTQKTHRAIAGWVDNGEDRIYFPPQQHPMTTASTRVWGSEGGGQEWDNEAGSGILLFTWRDLNYCRLVCWSLSQQQEKLRHKIKYSRENTTNWWSYNRVMAISTSWWASSSLCFLVSD